MADVRVPRFWPASVILTTLLVRRRDRRALAEATRNFRELAEIIAQRWQERDQRERELLALQGRVVRLTWAMVALTVAVLGVTAWAVLD